MFQVWIMEQDRMQPMRVRQAGGERKPVVMREEKAAWAAVDMLFELRRDSAFECAFVVHSGRIILERPDGRKWQDRAMQPMEELK